MSQRRFVVLDRDGTINVERQYLARPGQMELLPNAASGLRHLRKLGLGLVVITNQSGVGRGYFDWVRLDLIHQRLLAMLANEGIGLDGIYVCPHRPEDGCACRKPQPGLMERAAREHGFEPGEAFVIGDKVIDIELGRRVNATTLLVRTGYGARVAAQGAVACDHIVDDLGDAARVVGGLLYTNKEHSTQ